jgi:hypothetical protein
MRNLLRSDHRAATDVPHRGRAADRMSVARRPRSRRSSAAAMVVHHDADWAGGARGGRGRRSAPPRGHGGQAPRRSPGGEEQRPKGEVPARGLRRRPKAARVSITAPINAGRPTTSRRRNCRSRTLATARAMPIAASATVPQFAASMPGVRFSRSRCAARLHVAERKQTSCVIHEGPGVVKLGQGALVVVRRFADCGPAWEVAPVIHSVARGGPECRAVSGGSIKTGGRSFHVRGGDQTQERARPGLHLAP